MKYPLIFLVLDVLMFSAYMLAVLVHFIRRIFSGRTKL